MATVKVFGGLAFIPPQWRDSVGIGFHGQGQIVIQAWSKSDAEGMLEDRGERWAAQIMKQLRWHKGLPWMQLGLLREAGIINPDDIGVWVYHRGVKGDPVALIDPDGTPRVVAAFDYDRALTVARVA